MLKGSTFFKIFALAAALVTYFYIHNEIQIAEKKEVTDPSYELIKLTAKNLAVNVRLESTPPEGYRVIESGVKTAPGHILVIGPEAMLEHAQTAETGIVDIAESTKTMTRRIPIESVAGVHLTGEPYLVDVTVPIEKIQPSAKPEQTANIISPGK